LAALEIGVLSQSPTPGEPLVFDLDVAVESIQRKALDYDRDGDKHYDVISAFIKSMRGSDPDAAIYWLARMIDSGEDLRFIARRMVIFAAEDIGNADPQALLVATSAFHAADFVGFPEAQLPLAQAAIYLATAEKSNASAMAIWTAVADVKNNRTIPVPRHLRSSNYPGAKQLGHGLGYEYPHKYPDAKVDQDYLGVDKTYYRPTGRGHEALIKKFLQRHKESNP
jgi:putative ATPase